MVKISENYVLVEFNHFYAMVEVISVFANNIGGGILYLVSFMFFDDQCLFVRG